MAAASATSGGSIRPNWNRIAPGWLVSLAVHLVIVILVCLLFGRAVPTSGSVEDIRTAAIALVRRDGRQTHYFSEDDLSTASQSEAAGSTPAAGGGDESAFPDDVSPPVLAGLTLPSLPAAVAGGDSLVVAPQPGSGRRGPILPPGIDDAAILAADSAIPREQLPTGPTARMSLFGSSQAEGRSFVFLVDRSQSMGGNGLGAIQAAANELKSQISALTPEQTVQVIAYNQTTTYLSGRELIPATDANKSRLIEFVANIAAFGQTEHVRGLVAALKLKPEVVFLLTDGGDPLLTAADLRLIREQAGGRTSIHILHFGRGEAGEAADFLARLGAENGGSYTYIDMNRR